MSPFVLSQIIKYYLTDNLILIQSLDLTKFVAFLDVVQLLHCCRKLLLSDIICLLQVTLNALMLYTSCCASYVPSQAHTSVRIPLSEIHISAVFLHVGITLAPR